MHLWAGGLGVVLEGFGVGAMTWGVQGALEEVGEETMAAA